LEAARKLADWSATREANELYAKNFAVVAIPGISSRLKHIPNDSEQRQVKNDFAWMAENRDAILAEWQKRYANKSEAK
ncbi:MAG: putative 2-aminoethylphosphonate ABC transporter substrate-binding protein, partial [Anaerolineae bacterium]|nr:putative 2-aminoethylphosphonate ABC transporter substrate-binding protein [Anaerolineae bacterium]